MLFPPMSSGCSASTLCNLQSFLIDSELYLLLTVSLVSHAASCPVSLLRPEVPRAKPDKKKHLGTILITTLKFLT